MRIVPVETQDLTQVKELLEDASLSLAGIEDHFQHFLKLMVDGELVAVAGLEIYGNMGLLRSIAVVPEYRHSGLGRGLIRAMINKACALELSHLYLLTKTAAEYFRRFGFRPIGRQEVPPEVEKSEQFRSGSLHDAVCMHLKL